VRNIYRERNINPLSFFVPYLHRWISQFPPPCYGRRDPFSIVYLVKWSHARYENQLPDIGYLPPTKMMLGLRKLVW